MKKNFKEFTPELFLPALEEALGVSLTSFLRPFPSYINRVYEVRDDDGTPYVAKFYRPGRWTKEALEDEQNFLADCAEAELPVVSPLPLADGKTLGLVDGIHFAVFPKKGGRQFDIEGDSSWERVGSLLGRLHSVGARRKAPGRLTLEPVSLTMQYVNQLVDDAVVPSKCDSYRDICKRIIESVADRFDSKQFIRIHADFHTGNILERPDTGLMIIDFDDMMNGPAVQDFWLLLPDHYPACKRELALLMNGYSEFRDVDHRAPFLIEGLRAMRMIYFAHWCSMQRDDFQFQSRFPEWGSETFWAKEIGDLRNQYANIMDAFEI
ncbi:MAG: serine/threonine protein kinase [Fibrobacteres bacterium]|nr:serine/threonine protein kinase [Fibrobacterota bacterium]